MSEHEWVTAPVTGVTDICVENGNSEDTGDQLIYWALPASFGTATVLSSPFSLLHLQFQNTSGLKWAQRPFNSWDCDIKVVLRDQLSCHKTQHSLMSSPCTGDLHLQSSVPHDLFFMCTTFLVYLFRAQMWSGKKDLPPFSENRHKGAMRMTHLGWAHRACHLQDKPFTHADVRTLG